MKTQFKKLLLAVIICTAVLSTLSVNAQISGGVRAGVNFATEPVPDLYHVLLARPYAGVFGQYNLIPAFDIQVGLNYSGEGANYKDLGSEDTYQVRHSFLTVPVLAQFRFGFGGYIEAGPQFGFLLSAKAKVDDAPSEDTKSFYKGTDTGICFGIGYEIQKSSLRGLGISARYMRGLTNINKETDEDITNVKSRTLSVGFTYRLPAGKK